MIISMSIHVIADGIISLFYGYTPVFLPGESQGQRSLAGYNQWGRRELDANEVT